MAYEDIANWFTERLGETGNSGSPVSGPLAFIFWVIMGFAFGGVFLFIQSRLGKSNIFSKYWPIFLLIFLVIISLLK